jgi:hypothetical protein
VGANSGFPTTLLSKTSAYAAFRKESRMKFANATKFDRKSGASAVEGPAVNSEGQNKFPI